MGFDDYEWGVTLFQMMCFSSKARL
ncbi:hypothetical protein PO124_05115 [Bacillus licheniformis]|nr:hypothetical protein [Bacillus licheniformis]